MNAPMDNVRAMVRGFVSDNFLLDARQAAFADDASFLENHIIDSTGFLELVTWLEETFSIVVDDDDMVPENLDSVAALDAYIQLKRRSAVPW